MSYQVIFTDELYHHGIKGQKWGIRRFQNPDGTLTEAGKKKYGKRYEKRQEQIKHLTAVADSYKQFTINDKKYLDEVMNDEKKLNKAYKEMYGDETPESMGFDKMSKKEMVKFDIEQDMKEHKKMYDHYINQVKILKSTPINKMTRDEMKKVSKGATKAAFLLNTAGAVTVGTLIKKQGKLDKDTIKYLIAMDALFTGGAGAINSTIRDVVANNREKKILKENKN